MHIHTEAFILHKRKFQDYDYFVTLLTRSHGKITAICKGSRKITSKYHGQLEIFNLNQINLYKSPRNFIITESKIKKNYSKLKIDFKSTQTLLKLSEILFYTIPEEYPLFYELFDLIEKHLYFLEEYPEKSALIKEAFKIKICQKNGILSDLNFCSHCENKLNPEKKFYFCFENNGLICDKCIQNKSPKKEISLNTVKLLKFFYLNPLNEIIKLSFLARDLEEIQNILNTIIENHIHKKLHSYEMNG
ncbi:MAG: repair protein RecO protein [Candidatus Peregrinibacteria bacterium GW2011_GWA2_33_10]|nr:MAG: repair protein RecO protein [Candidatus Peregrinibacteria bacterium GW2011_GWA2_33_10]KKP38306.1 MAG: repair protein RecO, DNA repair protein RecO (recombination protein O) protein [Candidatus Peregrinibacteria bacterium GW2011_GWC2_33_13]OGJ46739.1 MAG: DNA repair protein RecO [Candidatus Peregrinibacteria bacterium RIFOXYA2_FULL_33_7]